MFFPKEEKKKNMAPSMVNEHKKTPWLHFFALVQTGKRMETHGPPPSLALNPLAGQCKRAVSLSPQLPSLVDGLHGFAVMESWS